MTLGELIALYRGSAGWSNLSARSKAIYESGIRSLPEGIVNKDVSNVKRADIVAIRDLLKNHPGKCRTVVSVLNNTLSYGYDSGIVESNVAASMKHMPSTKEINRWTDSEIRKFLKSNPPRHLRRAFMLALYTGQRRGDLVKMQWSDVKDKIIFITQQKTGKRVRIPIHPELRKELDTTPERFRFGPVVTNTYRQAYAPQSLQQAMAVYSRKIGINNRSIHGLRKSCAAILAELGCSSKQIMAITGHSSIKEVERYTREAEQDRLAIEAMSAWETSSTVGRDQLASGAEAA